MNLTRQFDIIELQDMEYSILQNLALWYGVDTLDKGKEVIMKELMAEQDRRAVCAEFAPSPHHPTARRERVYLVAKVSGLPTAEVAFKYDEARKVVEAYGYEAVIPTECVPANTSWHRAMRLLIPIMLQCDAYTLVDEPHTTAGGLIEDTIANWVQLPKLQFSKI